MLAFKRFNKTIVSKYKLYPIAVKKKREESSLGYICYSYRLLENIIQSICNLHMHSFKWKSILLVNKKYNLLSWVG